MYSSPGGYAGTMWCGSGIGNNPTFTGSLIGTGNIIAGSSSIFAWTNRAAIAAPTAANITLLNSAQTNFGLLQFGGTTSSFPALKPSGGRLLVRIADDTGYANLQAANLIASGAPATATASETQFSNSTATTVGAAGAASALPAAPLGYIVLNVGIQAGVKIPYYNA